MISGDIIRNSYFIYPKYNIKVKSVYGYTKGAGIYYRTDITKTNS